ncbi:ribonucleotide-diphosphate reductase subunit alpha, partial [Staphylococcus chromogenes]
MKTMEQKQYKHIELNNQVTKRNETGFFDLEKDQEALSVYLEEIDDKTVKFDNELDRLRFLVDQNFYYNVFEDYS